MEKYNKKIPIKTALKMLSPSFFDIYKTKYESILGDNFLKLKKTLTKIKKNTIKNPNSTTLIVGEIQSGKTSAILGLISKFFDSNINIALVFPAIDNVLLFQSTKRIEETFGTFASIYSINQFSINKKEQKNSKNISTLIKNINIDISNGKKIIIVSLKQSKRIQQVEEVLSKIKTNKNLILIDDEGDQASFNNVLSKEDTAIYSAFKSIKNNHYLNFFTITATPYAHIFVDENSPMKPDFAFALPISNKYTGLNLYHNTKNNYYDNLIFDITTKDLEKIDKFIRPDALENAIIDYFISVAYFHLKTGKINKTSFLFHAHRKNLNHELMKKMLVGLKQQIFSGLKNKTKRWILKFEKRMKTFKNFIIKNNEVEELLNLITLHINKTDVILGNQNNKKFKETLFEKNNSLNTIFIGSQMLQRGITLENLLVTYFSNRKKRIANADTILQRARWFGYRKDYLFLTRVYMDPISKIDFENLLETNNDVFERLKEIEKYENRFKPEFFEERLFIGLANLRGVRQTVAKNNKIYLKRIFQNNDFDLESISTKTLWDRVNKNGKKLNDLKFKTLKYNDFTSFKEIFFHEYNDISKEIFHDQQEKRVFEEFLFNSKIKIAIVNMGIPFKGSQIRKRSPKIKKQNFLQGDNLKEKNITKGYAGDRNIQMHKSLKDFLVIEIHKIELEKKGKIIYKPALVLPLAKITDFVYKI